MRGIADTEIFRNPIAKPPVRLDRLMLPRRKPEPYGRVPAAHCDDFPQVPHALEIPRIMPPEVFLARAQDQRRNCLDPARIGAGEQVGGSRL